MPLNREEKWILFRHFYGFNQTVLRVRSNLQPPAQPLDRLMVKTVDRPLARENIVQQGIGVRHRDGMRGLAPASLLPVVSLDGGIAFQVLVESAAELYVDCLNPPTDAQDRHTCPDATIEQRHFKIIAGAIDFDAAVLNRLAIQLGINVFPARQKDAVEVVER